MHRRRLRAVHVHGFSQGAGSSAAPDPGGRPRKLFSWGDFSASIRTSRLQVLITAKMVDHGNGSVSVHFRHNATGRGSVSVSLGPPTVPLCLTPHRPLTSQWRQQQQQERQNHQQQQQCSDNQQWGHNQQNQQQQRAESKAPRDGEPFRCRVEYEKVDRALKSVPCAQPRRSGPASLSPGPGLGPGHSAGSVPGPGSSCYREQVQSHVSWICSKPISAFCIYVAFQGANYRLAHKVCPDLHMVRTPSG
ncbi:neurexophilin-1-like [Petromyzon marinus]|nr:neurexophilin-1-like isoform X2 [Petromyzon marinus]